MKRAEVYSIIDQEREYQDTIRKQIQKDIVEDKDKSPEAFIIYMEQHLEDAKKASYQLDRKKTMSEIRKIVALGVAAMEAFGVSARQTKQFMTSDESLR